MESIQSALFSYTAKHFYSLQEEWAAAIRKASTRMTLYSGAPDLATPSHPPRTLRDTEKRQEITGFILAGGGEVRNHNYSSPSYIHGRALVMRETVNLIFNKD